MSDGTTTTPGTVTITVKPINDGPTGISDSGVVAEDNALGVLLDVLDNDLDPEGDALSVVTTFNGPSHGTVTINGGLTITYIPDSDYNGPGMQLALFPKIGLF